MQSNENGNINKIVIRSNEDDNINKLVTQPNEIEI
jgi:hypothetical protein